MLIMRHIKQIYADYLICTNMYLVLRSRKCKFTSSKTDVNNLLRNSAVIIKNEILYVLFLVYNIKPKATFHCTSHGVSNLVLNI